jgi:glycosyltransferase involved in cell wall biosynthesis
MDISLIICTRDRCQQLVRCLESVRDISFERSWEVIIVDNGSVDQTPSIARDFISSFGPSARYIFEPKPGKSNALNTALENATGEFLAFTDDDCYPAPDFLRAVWGAFEDTSVGYVGGRVMLHDPADLHIAVNESTIARTFPGRSFLSGSGIQGANMAFRRNVLFDIGGFDPLFGPGSRFPSAEDLDVVGRASAMGWEGRYCPDVVIRHHHRRKESDAPSLWKSTGIGIGAYHMKLLLTCGEWWWFMKSISLLGRHFKWSRIMFLWEPVGAVSYAHWWMTNKLRNGIDRRGEHVR